MLPASQSGITCWSHPVHSVIKYTAQSPVQGLSKRREYLAAPPKTEAKPTSLALSPLEMSSFSLRDTLGSCHSGRTAQTSLHLGDGPDELTWLGSSRQHRTSHWNHQLWGLIGLLTGVGVTFILKGSPVCIKPIKSLFPLPFQEHTRSPQPLQSHHAAASPCFFFLTYLYHWNEFLVDSI